MGTAETVNGKALVTSNEAVQRSVKNPELLARLCIRDGKPFKQSALQSGYSHSVACRGLKALCSESAPVAEAVNRESEKQLVTLDRLKPLAVNRLYREIIDGVNGMRAIEIAGRLKECDWFVRGNDQHFGVFLSIGESAPSDAIDIDTQYHE
jgi:hypothetical protein